MTRPAEHSQHTYHGPARMESATQPTRDSYYGHPIIKPPVWKKEIGWYLFTGGLAGASASLSLAAEVSGNPRLARTSRLIAAGAVSVSPVLLIKDLGRPDRFLNMLRVFKPTSPMSVGSWILAASGGAQSVAAACEVFGVLPRVRVTSQLAAGLLGPALSTYTAALIADTAVPVWHDARRELPTLFAASSCASAGAAAVLLGHEGSTGPARRLAVLGGAAGLGLSQVMEKRLGMVGEPYRTGRPGRYMRASKVSTALGLAATVAGKGLVRRAGAGLLLAGAAFERFAVFSAGSASAEDPRYTVEPQRERRVERGREA
jgi:polysulfide reductase-like protein